MAPGKSRRLVYVSAAVVASVILILAVILLQQPIQNKATPPPKTSAPGVATVAASAVGQTSATLNGNLSSLGTSSYSVIGFLYGKGPALSAATNETVANVTAATAFDETLMGLTPGVAYYFAAWARGDGFSLGVLMTFTTSASSTARAPSVATDAADSVTTSAAMLHGTLTDLGSASSATVGFRYGTSASLASATNVSLGGLSTAGTFAEQASGLAANTTYYVQAWAMGDGFATGSVLSFSTGTSGNGHHVPPGWAHAACPDIPKHAVGHGVHARCDSGVTWGEMKKGGGYGTLPAVLGATSGILSLVSLVSAGDRRGARGHVRPRSR